MCAGVLAVPGCMDDDACNYNMEANVTTNPACSWATVTFQVPCFPMRATCPRTRTMGLRATRSPGAWWVAKSQRVKAPRPSK